MPLVQRQLQFGIFIGSNFSISTLGKDREYFTDTTFLLCCCCWGREIPPLKHFISWHLPPLCYVFWGLENSDFKASSTNAFGPKATSIWYGLPFLVYVIKGKVGNKFGKNRCRNFFKKLFFKKIYEEKNYFKNILWKKKKFLVFFFLNF